MWRFLTLLLCLALPAQAAQEEVVLALSKDQVSITTDFDGSEILIFGAIKRESSIPEGPPIEVIVALSGPDSPVTVRRKEKQLGIWVNADAVDIASAPEFYAVATSGPMNEILTDEEDLRHRVSVERAILSIGAAEQLEDAQEFIKAAIRIRENNDQYSLNEGIVQVDEQTLFRTEIKMPPNLTEGNYTARILLTRGGHVVAQHDAVIDVRKVGLERFLYNLSRQQPFVYGLMSLAIAIFAGWSASAVFRLIKNG